MTWFKRTYHLLSLIAIILAASATSHAQLNSADSTHLALLKQELNLNQFQETAIDSVLRNASAELLALDKEMNRISRSDLDASGKEARQSEIREKKKMARENRDLAIQFMLTPEQRKIYDEKIKPSKPSVLHMGMNHDRSNCTVCVPK